MYAVASCLKWSEPLFDIDTDRPGEWELLLRLGGAALGTPVSDVDVAAMDDMYVQGLIATMCATSGTPLVGRDAGAAFAALTGSGPERLVDLGIGLGPWGDDLGRRPGGLTLEEVRRHPDGLWLADLEEGRLTDAVTTASGCIELIHPHIVGDIPRLAARLERTSPQMVLTSRRHLRSNNSWMHNVPALMRGRDRCTLLVHPVDASRLGLADDGMATVETDSGSVDVLVQVSDEMMPGVVSLPHGWGHGLPGTRLEVANAHPGVNSNLLNPVDIVDVPSNTLVVNGVPCRISLESGGRTNFTGPG